MLITKETDYALRILRALADGKRMTTAELARVEQVPLQFAYKILKKLQKNGIIRILRGPDGGSVLATELERVTLYRLMQAMEEDSSVSSCTKPGYECQWRKAHGDAVCRAHVHLTSIQKKLDDELDAKNLREILFGE
ncbi:HTH-type transcriptional repressor NsrR [bioreactor metagenome]|uniref:HTH-type transcriptional repressor NsrR n=1 Tax=bioreactor metagenome TaxID=1076179 RepID=A0A645IQ28_9ZZZZ